MLGILVNVRRALSLQSGLRLACFYNGQSLRAETKEAYADLLWQEIERRAAIKRHLQEQRAQLEADLHELKASFPYTAESSSSWRKRWRTRSRNTKG